MPRKRHRFLLVSLLLLVLLPTLISAAYLWTRATDQYVSIVGFSVRKEGGAPTLDLLGGITTFNPGGGASDTDILYEFIRSQDLVTRIDAKLDLRSKFSGHWPRDFFFAYDPSGTIEDLTDYWQRQVKVIYDDTTGLITLEVSAFTPEDAHEIATAIVEESTSAINDFSAIARDDATRYAREELGKALDRLTSSRQELTAFRMRTQIVDPAADLEGQMGVLSQLRAQMAEALVAHDLLIDNARDDDPRVIQSRQRIDAIRNRIDQERNKFGEQGAGPEGESYSELVSEYEKLAVDREFAETTYRAALLAYDSAVAEAQRQSRYLAAHIAPTYPESSRRPDRPVSVILVLAFALLAWSIMILVYYSIRDRG